MTQLSLIDTPPQKAKRGSRLPEDWVLPKSYGDWALGEGWSKETILAESEKFKDYWIAKSGKDATKSDWLATWRNWMRNSNTTRSINIAPDTQITKENIINMIFREFYQDKSVTEVDTLIRMQTWLKCLKEFTPIELMDAWQVYLIKGPRTEKGSLIRPDAGWLHHEICRVRGEKAKARRALLPAKPENVKPRATREQVDRILKDVNLRVRKVAT